MSLVIKPTMILLLAAALITVNTGQADELHDRLLVCRDLSSDAERLNCYDAAVDSREQPASPQPTAATTTPATAVPATISQEELFGKNSSEVQRTVEEATGSEPIDSISAQVSRLQQYDYDKVVVSLDNGQVWKQVDSSNVRLRVGDDVTIERASLGSFMLKKSGSKRTMRVSRMN